MDISILPMDISILPTDISILPMDISILPTDILRVIYEDFLGNYKYRNGQLMRQITADMKMPLWGLPIPKLNIVLNVQGRILWINSIVLTPYNPHRDHIEIKIIKQNYVSLWSNQDQDVITYSFYKNTGFTSKPPNLFILE